MEETKRYTVFVGGGEVNDHLLSKIDAELLAQEYIDDGYDDVEIDKYTDAEIEKANN